MTMRLEVIDQKGHWPGCTEACHPQISQNCDGTAAFYGTASFAFPWVGYVSTSDGLPVGGGAFKDPPQDGRVEIAYYTLRELEGRGYAAATAKALINIARLEVPGILVMAQTLPTPNASNGLLKKLGFAFAGTVQHPEDGAVWEWHLGA